MLIKKIPDTSGLVTTTVLNTKTSGVDNRIQNIDTLMNTTVLNTKVSENVNKTPNNSKYITTQKFVTQRQKILQQY